MSPSSRSLKLTVIAGPQKRSKWRITASTAQLGRAPECDIPLEDTQASWEHAEIEISEEAILLRDLGSTNHTYLNGARVTEAEIHDGDVVRIGSTELRASIEDARAVGQRPRRSSTGRRAPSSGGRTRLLGIGLAVAVVFLGMVMLFNFNGDESADGGDSGGGGLGDAPVNQTDVVAPVEAGPRGGVRPEPPSALALALFEEGKGLYQYGRLLEARDKLREAVRATPGYVEARRYLDRTRLALNVRIDSNLRRARSEIGALRYDEASRALEEALLLLEEDDARRAEALRLRARIPQ